jgi:hypothetical protein
MILSLQSDDIQGIKYMYTKQYNTKSIGLNMIAVLVLHIFMCWLTPVCNKLQGANYQIHAIK